MITCWDELPEKVRAAIIAERQKRQFYDYDVAQLRKNWYDIVFFAEFGRDCPGKNWNTLVILD
jgi:hypothetical protein